MSEIPIPSTIDDVTADWLGAVLARGGEPAPVVGFTAEMFGEGVGVSSSLYRVVPEYGPGGGGGHPESVVLKLRSVEDFNAARSHLLQMYQREAGFFSELAPHMRVRVPRCWHADCSQETPDYVIVMEDLAGYRVVSQVEGCGLEDARAVIDQVALYHADWWERHEDMDALTCQIPIYHELYLQVLPGMFNEGWEAAQRYLEIPEAVREVAPRYAENIPRMLDVLARNPRTLLHGDIRIDNMMFGPDGIPYVLDFQLTGAGNASYDIGYFLSQSLTSENRAAWERELFEHYVNALQAAGVSGVEGEALWETYEMACLYCLIYPMAGAATLGDTDERTFALYQEMMNRSGAAIADLDLGRLIP